MEDGPSSLRGQTVATLIAVWRQQPVGISLEFDEDSVWPPLAAKLASSIGHAPQHCEQNCAWFRDSLNRGGHDCAATGGQSAALGDAAAPKVMIGRIIGGAIQVEVGHVQRAD